LWAPPTPGAPSRCSTAEISYSRSGVGDLVSRPGRAGATLSDLSKVSTPAPPLEPMPVRFTNYADTRRCAAAAGWRWRTRRSGAPPSAKSATSTRAGRDGEPRAAVPKPPAKAATPPQIRRPGLRCPPRVHERPGIAAPTLW
jgi:hypothetical protein